MGPRLQERGVSAVFSFFHSAVSSLQWGRAYKSAEFRLRLVSDSHGHRASMGPRLQERGVSTKTTLRSNPLSGLQWGRAYKSAELRSSEASPDMQRMLQWGRAYKSAELVGIVSLIALGRLASMGPRLQERGVVNLGSVDCPVSAVASMGPRLQERGVSSERQ